MRGRNFLICGLTGWCMEILFTSVGSLARHDGRLIGQTSPSTVWLPVSVRSMQKSKSCRHFCAAASIQWVFFHSST